ncbi:DUF1834 family protein [Chromobacterium subtsugae]|uniref:DUF1834 family protein n=1 Tax=Chromobacterium subtsugae TaxID=251747 RepID=A0ABS7FHJ8_9NEIS|nr:MULTISPECIES: DUF1834 family protein [Chromobacterium]KUM02280.1 hypothetical protein Cv017_03935 [Chromobacterium subtsugae]KZE86235.1 hypothetical protein AWB61_17000 [Chromobacterium sp. F49]MBW7568081.1 DUF1834 family protein [Chromobacterium subtsugae]MBW8289545.1 DUF1834 family protein [Chromobacterium subtsugae]WSE91993.1 DUF1834 family protein [Chromobacterium subtsugae]
MSMLISVQTAIADRLRQGLGRMVREVAADLDETALCGLQLAHGDYASRLTPGQASPVINPQALARLPALWTVAGGIASSPPQASQRQRYKANAQFTVIVGDRLQADAGYAGAGVWQLVYAVRRLLASQDFGLAIQPLTPEKVRPLGQTPRDGQPWSLVACDFSTYWLDEALDNGRWPAPQGDADPDALFRAFGGRLEDPAKDWQSTQLNYSLAGNPTLKAQDTLIQPAPKPAP